MAQYITSSQNNSYSASDLNKVNMKIKYLNLLIQTTGSQGSEICLHLTANEKTFCHDIIEFPDNLSSKLPYELEVSDKLLVLQPAPPLFWLGILILSLLRALLPCFVVFLLEYLHSACKARQAFETFCAISIAANPAIRCWNV